MSLLAMKAVVLFIVFVTATDALSCLACNRAQCKIPHCTHTHGGYQKDACGCCDVCAKVLGEECGGPWMIFGRCDKGLLCKKDNDNDFNAKGICVQDFHSPPCPFVCHIYCRYGNVPDANGCATCHCNELPACKSNSLIGKHRKGCRTQCKKCIHGNVLDKYGCPTNICRKNRPQHNSSGCYRKPTVFCTREGRCCLHSSTCNPFPAVYKRDHNYHKQCYFQ